MPKYFANCLTTKYSHASWLGESCDAGVFPASVDVVALQKPHSRSVSETTALTSTHTINSTAAPAPYF